MGLKEEIKELEKRFSEAPDSRLFLPLADSLRSAGELKRAVRLCREGLERFPDFTSARVLLGECLAELGELRQAEETFELLRGEDRENVLVIKKLAALAGQQGNRPKAEALLREAADLSGETQALEDESGAPDARMDILAQEEFIPPVPDSLDSAAEAELEPEQPGEIFLTHTLADIYRHQGHLSRAYEIYQGLLARDPESLELKEKLEAVGARLKTGGGAKTGQPAQSAPGMSIKAPAGGTAGPEPGGLDEPLEERIDAIFRFLLGDQSAALSRAGVSAPGKSGPEESAAFVEMLDNWITGIRGEAGAP